jgi:hypothetical protein
MQRLKHIALFILVAALLLPLLADAQSSSHSYVVLNDDKQVGNIYVTKMMEGNLVHYCTRSEITLTMLFKIHISYRVKATFENGVLQASDATVYLNGAVRTKVEAVRRNGFYDLIIDGNLSRLDGDIFTSGSTLYFNKPAAGSLVFSETSGGLKPMSALKDGRLLLRNPQKVSDLNTYFYDSATLLKTVEIEHAFFPTLTVYHSEAAAH